VNPCERYLTAINERVDGTLGPIRGAELDLHLEGCEDCRALLADLQAIADAGRALPVLAPPAHVWSQIAGQLRAERRVPAAPPRRQARQSYTMLALAATLALAVGGSLFVLFPRQAPVAPAVTETADQHPQADNAAAGSSVQGAAGEFDRAAEHVRKGLELLDPETAARVEQDILVMDQALASARKAVAADPQSEAANNSLYGTLKQKIKFLHDTIALMNKMRQGDAAGAAEIVEGKS
jgi:hypothetical protein